MANEFSLKESYDRARAAREIHALRARNSAMRATIDRVRGALLEVEVGEAARALALDLRAVEKAWQQRAYYNAMCDVGWDDLVADLRLRKALGEVAREAEIDESAIEDAIDRAEHAFRFNDSEQLEARVFGPDGKTLLSPHEWFRSMKALSPQWWSPTRGADEWRPVDLVREEPVVF